MDKQRQTKIDQIKERERLNIKLSLAMQFIEDLMDLETLKYAYERIEEKIINKEKCIKQSTSKN